MVPPSWKEEWVSELSSASSSSPVLRVPPHRWKNSTHPLHFHIGNWTQMRFKRLDQGCRVSYSWAMSQIQVFWFWLLWPFLLELWNHRILALEVTIKLFILWAHLSSFNYDAVTCSSLCQCNHACLGDES